MPCAWIFNSPIEVVTSQLLSTYVQLSLSRMHVRIYARNYILFSRTAPTLLGSDCSCSSHLPHLDFLASALSLSLLDRYIITNSRPLTSVTVNPTPFILVYPSRPVCPSHGVPQPSLVNDEDINMSEQFIKLCSETVACSL